MEITIRTCFSAFESLAKIESPYMDKFNFWHEKFITEYAKYEKAIEKMKVKYTKVIDREHYACQKIYPFCDKLLTILFNAYNSFYSDIVYTKEIHDLKFKLFECSLYLKDILRQNIDNEIYN